MAEGRTRELPSSGPATLCAARLASHSHALSLATESPTSGALLTGPLTRPLARFGPQLIRDLRLGSGDGASCTGNGLGPRGATAPSRASNERQSAPSARRRESTLAATRTPDT